MTVAIKTEAPPIRADETGTLRVGNTRVLLDLVILAHNQGESPERIVECYDTLALGDVYAVVAYYLHNRDEIDAYLEERERGAAAMRREIEARQGTQEGLRERLEARREQFHTLNMLRFLADENFNGKILREVLKRVPSVDFVRAQDVGLVHCPDPEVLAWAAQQDRIVVTHDRETMLAYAMDRVKQSLAMPGVILVDTEMTIGIAVYELSLAVECLDATELVDRTVFIPL